MIIRRRAGGGCTRYAVLILSYRPTNLMPISLLVSICNQNGQKRVPLSPESQETHRIAEKSNLFQGAHLKNYLAITILCMTTVFALPAHPQTSTTSLSMSARWDDGSNVQGIVTFGKQNASGPDTVVVTQTLSNGSTNVSESLGATTMYDVTLVDSAGTQLIKFPIATAMINPGNLKQAQIRFVFRKADNSLKSGNISVSMEF